MTHNIIYTPRKTSLSETGSRSLTSELSVQRPEGASYGGSQTWFSSPSIRGYGCGLIAAHDLLWYLERKESLTAQTDRHRSGEQLVSDSRSWEDYERSVKRLHRLFPILPRLGINGLMLSAGLNLAFLLRRLPYRACWHIGYRNTGKEINVSHSSFLIKNHTFSTIMHRLCIFCFILSYVWFLSILYLFF